MKFSFFISFALFTFILSRVIKHQKNLSKNKEQSFWERERASNQVRRKSLDHLNYIQIPLETFPFHILCNDEQVTECMETIQTLSACPIVNLTGYSNTDLKLEYGTANLPILMQYDQNYTVLIRTLQKWAEILYEKKYMNEAKILLEFALHTNTDISKTYYLLAEIYYICGEENRISDLIHQAENLHSSTKNLIVHTLQKSYP